MTSKSIGEVATYKPIAQCGIEELAAQQITAKPSGGILFARKTEHREKDAARKAIVDLLGRDRFPKGLSVLSMPGLDWKFERKLLDKREGGWAKRKGPHHTYLTCVENDRSIYHAALMQMPGLQQDNSVAQVLPPTAIAERVVRNRWVCRFFFANVDDLMAAQKVPFDAAWIDYTGPLTLKRLRILADFFEQNIRGVLIVTALKARWSRETSEAISAAGGHSQWLRRAIPGVVMHDLEYQDGASPMSQIAFAKAPLPLRRDSHPEVTNG